MEQFEILRTSNLTDPSLNSLVLVVRKPSGQEVVSVFCRNDEWTVAFSASAEDTIMSWADFLELTHQISLFVAVENKAMLHERGNTDLDENK